MTFFSGCKDPADIVFVMDSSGSVGEENFQRMKEFIKDILQQLNVVSCKYRIGLVKYGSSAFVQFHLNSYNTTAELMTAIDGVGFSFGYTFTADALRVTREEVFTNTTGDRPEAKNIIVLLTDGLANVGTRDTLQEVRRARNEEIYIIPIGIAVSNKDELLDMATDENGIFFAENFAGINSLTGSLVEYMLEGKASY